MYISLKFSKQQTALKKSAVSKETTSRQQITGQGKKVKRGAKEILEVESGRLGLHLGDF